ncbi:toxin glutamine deamidase domain-containing protein [Paractinoplanes hotanensis]|uniref:Toxin glutamine deamidase domain-containing protein n=1 Tax=Paractinoplanes hotanensis TaxID=2906497 RepID=A0ABT0YDW1_9ACTN|nr:toxin glutamine deamidase domain-containing protein [Actinoplanes hotanensis]MCM4084239.1 toxin glutamine deamidase domain-containing protein [Actinoplanes hotanensis]
MALQAPDPLARFFLWFFGMEFPGLNEDKLAGLATATADLGRGVDGSQRAFVEAVQRILDGVEGQSKRAFARKAVDLLALMQNAGRFTRAVGSQHQMAAGTVFATKVTALTTVALLMLELAHAISVFPLSPVPWFNFWAKAPLVRGSLRAFLTAMASKLAGMSRMAAGEALEELIAALVGELAALGKFGKSVDGKQVLMAGAVGGAFGALMGGALPAIRGAGGAVAKVTGLDDAVAAASATPLNKAILDGTANVGESAVSGTVEGAIEMLLALAMGGGAGNFGVAVVSSMSTDALFKAGEAARNALDKPRGDDASSGPPDEKTVDGAEPRPLPLLLPAPDPIGALPAGVDSDTDVAAGGANGPRPSATGTGIEPAPAGASAQDGGPPPGPDVEDDGLSQAVPAPVPSGPDAEDGGPPLAGSSLAGSPPFAGGGSAAPQAVVGAASPAHDEASVIPPVVEGDPEPPAESGTDTPPSRPAVPEAVAAPAGAVPVPAGSTLDGPPVAVTVPPAVGAGGVTAPPAGASWAGTVNSTVIPATGAGAASSAPPAATPASSAPPAATPASSAPPAAGGTAGAPAAASLPPTGVRPSIDHPAPAEPEIVDLLSPTLQELDPKVLQDGLLMAAPVAETDAPSSSVPSAAADDDVVTAGLGSMPVSLGAPADLTQDLGARPAADGRRTPVGRPGEASDPDLPPTEVSLPESALPAASPASVPEPVASAESPVNVPEPVLPAADPEPTPEAPPMDPAVAAHPEPVAAPPLSPVPEATGAARHPATARQQMAARRPAAIHQRVTTATGITPEEAGPQPVARLVPATPSAARRRPPAGRQPARRRRNARAGRIPATDAWSLLGLRSPAERQLLGPVPRQVTQVYMYHPPSSRPQHGEQRPHGDGATPPRSVDQNAPGVLAAETAPPAGAETLGGTARGDRGGVAEALAATTLGGAVAATGTDAAEGSDALARVTAGGMLAADYRRTAQEKIAYGRRLLDDLHSLGRRAFIRKTANAVALKALTAEVKSATHRLERELDELDRRIRAGDPILTGSTAGESLRGVEDALETFTKQTSGAVDRVVRLLEREATRSVVEMGDGDRLEKWRNAVDVLGGILPWVAQTLAPEGMSAVPGAVDAGIKTIEMIAVELYNDHHQKLYESTHSTGATFDALDQDPTLIARAIVERQKHSFDLLLRIVGVGAGYLPWWPVVQTALTHAMTTYLDKRLEATERDLEGGDAVTVSERLWTDGREFLLERLKLENLGPLIDAGRGKPDQFALGAIGAGVGAELLVGLLTAVVPPKPLERISGDDLRTRVRTVRDLRGNPEQWDRAELGTGPGAPIGEPVQEPEYDRFGRRLQRERDRGSADGVERRHVAVDFLGMPVWGDYTVRTGDFEPVRPDPASFTDQRVWLNRTIGPGHYVAGDVKVEGSWYQPWPDRFDYLFVPFDSDRRPEWAQAMAPTSKVDGGRYNMKATFDEHPDWLRPFAWDPPRVLTVDFAEESHEPRMDAWALRNFARHTASLARGGTPDAPAVQVSVEGGGNGRGTLRRWESSVVRRGKDPVTRGLHRARAVHAKLEETLRQELIGQLPNTDRAEIENMLTAVLSPATDRESDATGSRSPRTPDVSPVPEAANRQVRAWVETEPAPVSSIGAAGSTATAVSPYARWSTRPGGEPPAVPHSDRPGLEHLARHLADAADDGQAWDLQIEAGDARQARALLEALMPEVRERLRERGTSPEQVSVTIRRRAAGSGSGDVVIWAEPQPAPPTGLHDTEEQLVRSVGDRLRQENQPTSRAAIWQARQDLKLRHRRPPKAVANDLPTHFDDSDPLGETSDGLPAERRSTPTRFISSTLADDEAVRSVYPWLTSVNPDSSRTNCVLTAIVTDMNLVPGEPLAWQAPAEGAMPGLNLVRYQRDRLRLAGLDSLLYRTDLESVRRSMTAAPVGARGILLVPNRAGISHAFNVVRGEAGVLFLDGQRGGLARHPEAVDGWFFLPMTSGIDAPAGPRLAHGERTAPAESPELVDPGVLDGQAYGLGGTEAEITSGYITWPGERPGSVPEELFYIAGHRGSGLAVSMTHRSFKWDGTRYWTMAEGPRGVARRMLASLELVIDVPFPLLARERDQLRRDAEASRQYRLEIYRRLASTPQLAAGFPGWRQGVPITEIFRPSDNWEFEELEINFRRVSAGAITYSPVSADATILVHPQYTIGAALGGIHEFLSEVHVLSRTAQRIKAKEILGDGLEVSQAMAASISENAYPRPTEYERRVLRDVLVLAYTHTIGYAAGLTGGDLMKSYHAALSRIDLSVLRAGAPPRVQQLLVTYRDHIRTAFTAKAEHRFPDYSRQYEPQRGPLRGGILGARDSSLDFTAGDYLDNALDPRRAGRVVSQQDAFGQMMTLEELDRSRVGLVPLVPLELRWIGPGAIAPDAMERTFDELAQSARRAAAVADYHSFSRSEYGGHLMTALNIDTARWNPYFRSSVSVAVDWWQRILPSAQPAQAADLFQQLVARVRLVEGQAITTPVEDLVFPSTSVADVLLGVYAVQSGAPFSAETRETVEKATRRLALLRDVLYGYTGVSADANPAIDDVGALETALRTRLSEMSSQSPGFGGPPWPGGGYGEGFSHGGYSGGGQFSTGGWPFAATGFRGVSPGADTTPMPSAYTPEQIRQRFPLLGTVNPQRATGTETDSNCVVAAISYVLARDEGAPVEASGSTELPGVDLINFQRQRLGLPDDEHLVWLTPSIEALTGSMLASGEGTLVLLAARGDDVHINHVYVGEVDHLGVTFLNPQTGELAALPAATTALAVLPLTHGMVMPAGARMLTPAEVNLSTSAPRPEGSADIEGSTKTTTGAAPDTDGPSSTGREEVRVEDAFATESTENTQNTADDTAPPPHPPALSKLRDHSPRFAEALDWRQGDPSGDFRGFSGAAVRDDPRPTIQSRFADEAAVRAAYPWLSHQDGSFVAQVNRQLSARNRPAPALVILRARDEISARSGGAPVPVDAVVAHLAPVPQGVRDLAAMGRVVVRANPDGDCFFHAFLTTLAAARHTVDPGPAAVPGARDLLARQVGPHAFRSEGGLLPDRALDATFNRHLVRRAGPAATVEEVQLQLWAAGAGEEVWEDIRNEVRQLHSWNHESGDLFPYLAAMAYQVQIRIIDRDGGDPVVIPNPGRPEIVLYRSSATHWEGTAAAPAGPFGRFGAAVTDDPAMLAEPTPSDLDGRSVGFVFDWLRGINSAVKDADPAARSEFATNCVVAVQATDMALRDPEGAIYQAPPLAPQPGSHLVRMQQQQLGPDAGQTRGVWQVPDIGVIRDAMLAADDGARGVVIVRREGSDVGHAFNVVRHTVGGRPAVTFLDGQTGTVARLPHNPKLWFLPLTADISPDARATRVPDDDVLPSGLAGPTDATASAEPAAVGPGELGREVNLGLAEQPLGASGAPARATTPVTDNPNSRAVDGLIASIEQLTTEIDSANREIDEVAKRTDLLRVLAGRATGSRLTNLQQQVTDGDQRLAAMREQLEVRQERHTALQDSLETHLRAESSDPSDPAGLVSAVTGGTGQRRGGVRPLPVPAPPAVPVPEVAAAQQSGNAATPRRKSHLEWNGDEPILPSPEVIREVATSFPGVFEVLRAQARNIFPLVPSSTQAAAVSYVDLQLVAYVIYAYGTMEAQKVAAWRAASNVKRGRRFGRYYPSGDKAGPTSGSGALRPAEGTTPPPHTTGVELGRVPADGRCQLYSVIGAATGRVLAFLKVNNLGDEQMHSWLENGETVIADLAYYAQPGRRRDEYGLLHADTLPARAANALSELVRQYLDDRRTNPAEVPPWVVAQYRLSNVGDSSAEIAGWDRSALLEELAALQVVVVTDPSSVPLELLRDRYIAARTDELTTSGMSRRAAQNMAEEQVRLTHDATGRARLHDDSLSTRRMLDYVNGVPNGRPVTVAELPDEALRGTLVMERMRPDRTVTTSEFNAMYGAVTRWAQSWNEAEGEAFLPLIAAALNLRISIVIPGVSDPMTFGLDNSLHIEVERYADHYTLPRSSGRNPDPGPVASAPAARPLPATPSGPSSRGARGRDPASDVTSSAASQRAESREDRSGAEKRRAADRRWWPRSRGTGSLGGPDRAVLEEVADATLAAVRTGAPIQVEVEADSDAQAQEVLDALMPVVRMRLENDGLPEENVSVAVRMREWRSSAQTGDRVSVRLALPEPVAITQEKERLAREVNATLRPRNRPASVATVWRAREVIAARTEQGDPVSVRQIADLVALGLPDAEFVRVVNQHLEGLHHLAVDAIRVADARQALLDRPALGRTSKDQAERTAHYIKFGRTTAMTGFSRDEVARAAQRSASSRDAAAARGGGPTQAAAGPSRAAEAAAPGVNQPPMAGEAHPPGSRAAAVPVAETDAPSSPVPSAAADDDVVTAGLGSMPVSLGAPADLTQDLGARPAADGRRTPVGRPGEASDPDLPPTEVSLPESALPAASPASVPEPVASAESPVNVPEPVLPAADPEPTPEAPPMDPAVAAHPEPVAAPPLSPVPEATGAARHPATARQQMAARRPAAIHQRVTTATGITPEEAGPQPVARLVPATPSAARRRPATGRQPARRRRNARAGRIPATDAWSLLGLRSPAERQLLGHVPRQVTRVFMYHAPPVRPPVGVAVTPGGSPPDAAMRSPSEAPHESTLWDLAASEVIVLEGMAEITADRSHDLQPIHGRDLRSMLDRHRAVNPDWDPGRQSPEMPNDVGATTVTALRQLRRIAMVSTTDEAVDQLVAQAPEGDDAAPQRVRVLVVARVRGLPDDVEALAAWVTRVLRHRLSHGFARWAERNDGMVTPQLVVDYEVRPPSPTAAGWDTVEVRSLGFEPVPPSAPRSLTGQANRLPQPWTATVRVGRSGVLPADQARFDLVVEQIAQRVSRAGDAGAQPVLIFLTLSRGPHHHDDAADTDDFGGHLRDAVQHRMGAALGGTQAAARRAAELVEFLAVTTEDGPQPTTGPDRLSIEIPPVERPLPIQDRHRPELDYLSTWRYRTAATSSAGWWRLTNPVRSTTELVAQLPDSIFRTVRADNVDVGDPLGDAAQMVSGNASVVRYGVARILVRQPGNAEPRGLRVFRLRLHLRGAAGVHRAQLRRLEQEAASAVNRVFNYQFQLPGDDADQLHVDVRFTDASAAHHVLDVATAPPGGNMLADSATWSVAMLSMAPARRTYLLAHEISHLLGTVDEYVDPQAGTGGRPLPFFRRDSLPDFLPRMPRRSAMPRLMGGLGREDAVAASRADWVSPRYLMYLALAQESAVRAPETRLGWSGSVPLGMTTDPDTWSAPAQARAALVPLLTRRRGENSELRELTGLALRDRRYRDDLTRAVTTLFAADHPRAPGTAYLVLYGEEEFRLLQEALTGPADERPALVAVRDEPGRRHLFEILVEITADDILDADDLAPGAVLVPPHVPLRLTGRERRAGLPVLRLGQAGPAEIVRPPVPDAVTEADERAESSLRPPAGIDADHQASAEKTAEIPARRAALQLADEAGRATRERRLAARSAAPPSEPRPRSGEEGHPEVLVVLDHSHYSFVPPASRPRMLPVPLPTPGFRLPAVPPPVGTLPPGVPPAGFLPYAEPEGRGETDAPQLIVPRSVSLDGSAMVAGEQELAALAQEVVAAAQSGRAWEIQVRAGSVHQARAVLGRLMPLVAAELADAGLSRDLVSVSWRPGEVGSADLRLSAEPQPLGPADLTDHDRLLVNSVSRALWRDNEPASPAVIWASIQALRNRTTSPSVSAIRDHVLSGGLPQRLRGGARQNLSARSGPGDIRPEDVQRLRETIDGAGSRGVSRSELVRRFRAFPAERLTELLARLGADQPDQFREWEERGQGTRNVTYYGQVSDTRTNERHPDPPGALGLRMLGAPVPDDVPLQRAQQLIDAAGPDGLSFTQLYEKLKRHHSANQVSELVRRLFERFPEDYRTWNEGGRSRATYYARTGSRSTGEPGPQAPQEIVAAPGHQAGSEGSFRDRNSALARVQAEIDRAGPRGLSRSQLVERFRRIIPADQVADSVHWLGEHHPDDYRAWNEYIQGHFVPYLGRARDPSTREPYPPQAAAHAIRPFAMPAPAESLLDHVRVLIDRAGPDGITRTQVVKHFRRRYPAHEVDAELARLLDEHRHEYQSWDDNVTGRRKKYYGRVPDREPQADVPAPNGHGAPLAINFGSLAAAGLNAESADGTSYLLSSAHGGPARATRVTASQLGVISHLLGHPPGRVTPQMAMAAFGWAYSQPMAGVAAAMSELGYTVEGGPVGPWFVRFSLPPADESGPPDLPGAQQVGPALRLDLTGTADDASREEFVAAVTYAYRRGSIDLQLEAGSQGQADAVLASLIPELRQRIQGHGLSAEDLSVSVELRESRDSTTAQARVFPRPQLDYAGERLVREVNSILLGRGRPASAYAIMWTRDRIAARSEGRQPVSAADVVAELFPESRAERELRAMGRVVVPTEPDGDCFYRAFLGTAATTLGRGRPPVTVPEMRNRLAQQLGPGARSSEGGLVPDQVLDAAYYRHIVLRAERARITPDALQTQLVTEGRTQEIWEDLRAEIRRSRSWDNSGGELAPYLAAMEYGVRIRVFSHNSVPQQIGHAGAPEIVLYRPAVNHWEGTAGSSAP